MKGRYIFNGKTMPFTASEAVACGELVKVGDVYGVATTNMNVGETGTLQMDSVYEFSKDTSEIQQGKKVYLSEDKTKVSATGTEEIGYAFEYASADAKTIRVKMKG